MAAVAAVVHPVEAAELLDVVRLHLVVVVLPHCEESPIVAEHQVVEGHGAAAERRVAGDYGAVVAAYQGEAGFRAEVVAASCSTAEISVCGYASEVVLEAADRGEAALGGAAGCALEIATGLRGPGWAPRAAEGSPEPGSAPAAAREPPAVAGGSAPRSARWPLTGGTRRSGSASPRACRWSALPMLLLYLSWVSYAMEQFQCKYNGNGLNHQFITLTLSQLFLVAPAATTALVVLPGVEALDNGVRLMRFHRELLQLRRRGRRRRLDRRRGARSGGHVEHGEVNHVRNSGSEGVRYCDVHMVLLLHPTGSITY